MRVETLVGFLDTLHHLRTESGTAFAHGIDFAKIAVLAAGQGPVELFCRSIAHILERMQSMGWNKDHGAWPDGLRYVSFNLEDGLTFVHIAVIEGEGNPLTATDAFKTFVADIKGRCDEPPAASGADIVGSYRLFWERDGN